MASLIAGPAELIMPTYLVDPGPVHTGGPWDNEKKKIPNSEATSDCEEYSEACLHF